MPLQLGPSSAPSGFQEFFRGPLIEALAFSGGGMGGHRMDLGRYAQHHAAGSSAAPARPPLHEAAALAPGTVRHGSP